MCITLIHNNIILWVKKNSHIYIRHILILQYALIYYSQTSGFANDMSQASFSEQDKHYLHKLQRRWNGPFDICEDWLVLLIAI